MCGLSLQDVPNTSTDSATCKSNRFWRAGRKAREGPENKVQRIRVWKQGSYHGAQYLMHRVRYGCSVTELSLHCLWRKFLNASSWPVPLPARSAKDKSHWQPHAACQSESASPHPWDRHCLRQQSESRPWKVAKQSSRARRTPALQSPIWRGYALGSRICLAIPAAKANKSNLKTLFKNAYYQIKQNTENSSIFISDMNDSLLTQQIVYHLEYKKNKASKRAGHLKNPKNKKSWL